MNLGELVQAFINRQTNRRGEITKQLSSSPVYYVGNTIYSYGVHFPMAVLLFDQRHDVRAALVQTRKYGPVTGRHLGTLRDVLYKNGITQIPTELESERGKGW